jgi:hypothetical protein
MSEKEKASLEKLAEIANKLNDKSLEKLTLIGEGMAIACEHMAEATRDD